MNKLLESLGYEDGSHKMSRDVVELPHMEAIYAYNSSYLAVQNEDDDDPQYKDRSDVVEMTLVPGKGTTVVVNGATKGTIEGDDFAEALVNVWVGDSPPTDEFKKGVLGG